jgi:hypothetical protein
MSDAPSSNKEDPMKLPGLKPTAYCSACGRAFYSDKRRPCRCGATARTVSRKVDDRMVADDKL